jgi:non-canonical poly(A) RNA polymerase PAPD5/7
MTFVGGHLQALTWMIRLAIEIEKFYQFSRADHFETLVRKHLIEQVRDHVRETLPDHVLEVFGSERTGLALATSDIDFRLLRKEHLGEAALSKLPPSPEQRTEAMRDLHHLHWHGLRTHKAYLLSWLRYARYPLISLQDRRSGLDVQIVLSNDTSLSRGFIKQYLEEYPYLRQLYFVVKTMFDVRGLSDVFRGGFGSYSLFMMIVASIKHSPHPRNDAAGGLINFLKFYRNFNTTKHGLSIEPELTFDKAEEAVVTDTVKTKLEVGIAFRFN